MNMLHMECARKKGGALFASNVTSVDLYDSLGYSVVDCAAGPVTRGKIWREEGVSLPLDRQSSFQHGLTWLPYRKIKKFPHIYMFSSEKVYLAPGTV